MNLQALNVYNNTQVNIPSSDVYSDAKQVGDASAARQLLDNASPGDYIQGTVVSAEDGIVQISVNQDVLISARLNASANLVMGESVVFSVRSNDSSGLFLSPLFKNNDGTSMVSGALKDAGLISDERNISMVDSMIREGMSIGKDEVISMAKTLGNISTVDIPDAVTLTKLGIEPTNDNLNQFNSYLGYQHQITNAVNEVINQIPDTLENMVKENNAQAAIDLTRDILDILTEQGAMNISDENTIVYSELDTPLTSVLNSEDISLLGELISDNGINTAFSELMEEGGVSLRDTLFVLDDLINRFASERPGETGTDAADFDSNAFLKQLQQASNSNVVDRLSQNAQNETDLMKNNLTKLITSKPVSELIKSAINKEWKLTPEQVGENKQVSNLYKRMTEQTSRLISALENKVDPETPLAKQTVQLSNNLNFMNELNHMFNYVQLPMRLMGNDAHGELYVYSNKKHLASEDGAVSALLHLDMDNLGPTDVYVAMNSNNHVNTHFYLPNEESLDLIALHIDELNERLNKRGYSMNAEFTTKDIKSSLMSEILEDNKSNVPISFSKFDAKA